MHSAVADNRQQQDATPSAACWDTAVCSVCMCLGFISVHDSIPLLRAGLLRRPTPWKLPSGCASCSGRCMQPAQEIHHALQAAPTACMHALGVLAAWSPATLAGVTPSTAPLQPADQNDWISQSFSYLPACSSGHDCHRSHTAIDLAMTMSVTTVTAHAWLACGVLPAGSCPPSSRSVKQSCRASRCAELAGITRCHTARPGNTQPALLPCQQKWQHWAAAAAEGGLQGDRNATHWLGIHALLSLWHTCSSSSIYGRSSCRRTLASAHRYVALAAWPNM